MGRLKRRLTTGVLSLMLTTLPIGLLPGVAGAEAYTPPCFTQPPIGVGASGDVVDYIQARVAQVVPGVTVDGDFGPLTQQGLKQYQTAAGLPASGVAGPETWAQMCSVKQIILSQSHNWAYARNADGSVYAEGGVIDNPAELNPGAYSVIWWANPNYDATSSGEAGNWRLNKFIGFAGKDGSIGFHQIPIDKATGEPMHGEEILGTNLAASHGCIRVGAAMADALWNFVDRVGIPVVVLRH